jgi:hypothetical protein
MKVWVVAIAAVTWLPAAALGAEWRYDATMHGIAFKQVKTQSSGLAIGLLAADTVISGRPCRRGWVHVHSNGRVARFTAAEDITLERFRIPAGTWVAQDTTGVVVMCAFPRDIEVQGRLCRGSGGPKGVQTAFYPTGALKQFFLVRPTRIDDVPCDRGLVRGSVELHENGRLKSCLLAGDFQQGGETFRRGTRIEFDADGRVRTGKR